MIVTIEEAQAKLPELIDELKFGEEIIITRNGQPVAKVVFQEGELPRAVYGRGRGKGIILSDDNEHLKDFEEYMS